MAQKTFLYHLSETRFFPLEDLTIPPKKYDRFLAEIVNAFTDLVLSENKGQSLEEVTEKYKKRILKLNPDSDPETIFDPGFDDPLIVTIQGELTFYKRDGRRQKNKPYRSSEYTEHIFQPYRARLDENKIKRQLSLVVRDIRKALNTHYPQRKGKLTVRERKPATIYDCLSGFSFRLKCKSMPTSMLEAEASLVDYGSMGNCLWPAIKISAEQLSASSLRLPQKVVDVLSQVVEEHYKVDYRMQGIGYQTKYNKTTRRTS